MSSNRFRFVFEAINQPNDLAFDRVEGTSHRSEILGDLTKWFGGTDPLYLLTGMLRDDLAWRDDDRLAIAVCSVLLDWCDGDKDALHKLIDETHEANRERDSFIN